MSRFSLLFLDDDRHIEEIEADNLIAAIQFAIGSGGKDTDIYEDGAYAYSISQLVDDPDRWLVFRKTDRCLHDRGASLMLADDPTLFPAYG